GARTFPVACPRHLPGWGRPYLSPFLPKPFFVTSGFTGGGIGPAGHHGQPPRQGQGGDEADRRRYFQKLPAMGAVMGRQEEKPRVFLTLAGGHQGCPRQV